MAVNEKKFVMKVYDPDTDELSKTFSDKYFVSKPNFSIEINGGLSEMTMEMALPIGEKTQEDGDMYDIPKLGDICRFYVYDRETPDGQVIYSGICSNINYRYRKNEWSWTLGFLPNSTYLAKKILRDSGDTTVSYNSNDPADIIKDILDKAGTSISYLPETIRDTDLSRTYEFEAQYSLDAIRKIASLLPKGWFFYVGADDYVYLKNHDQGNPTFTYWGTAEWGSDYWNYDPDTDNTIIHQLYSGTDISRMEYNKDIINLINRVLFVGGDIGGGVKLYNQYENSLSQDEFGLFEKIRIDERVLDDDTAESMSERELDINSVFDTTAYVEVLDSNEYDDNRGYDIESFAIGQKIQVRTDRGDEKYTVWGDFTWGVDYWKYSPYAIGGIPYIIKKVNYNYNSVLLECSLNPEISGQRIEDINRNLRNYRLLEIPNAPS